MRLLLLLSLAACRDIHVDLGGDTADADADTDADSDTDSDADADTGTPWTGPDDESGWRPGPAVAFAGEGALPYGRGVWFADVMGDANLDLVHVRVDASRTFDEGWLRIDTYPGHGDGTFGVATSVFGIAAEGLEVVALADVGGDGRLDAISATLDGVNVFHGNGDGFAEPVVTSVPGLQYGVPGVVDLEGDGMPEIVVNALDNGWLARVEVLRRPSVGLAFEYLTAFRPGNAYNPSAVIAVPYTGTALEQCVLGGTQGDGGWLAYAEAGSPQWQYWNHVELRVSGGAIWGGFNADFGDGPVVISEGPSGLEMSVEWLAESIRANDEASWGDTAVPVDLDGDGDLDILELGGVKGVRADDPNLLQLIATPRNPAGFADSAGFASTLLAFGYPSFHAIDAADLDGDGCAEVVFLGGYDQQVYLAPGVCD